MRRCYLMNNSVALLLTPLMKLPYFLRLHYTPKHSGRKQNVIIHSRCSIICVGKLRVNGWKIKKIKESPSMSHVAYSFVIILTFKPLNEAVWRARVDNMIIIFTLRFLIFHLEVHENRSKPLVLVLRQCLRLRLLTAVYWWRLNWEQFQVMKWQTIMWATKCESKVWIYCSGECT